MNRVQTANVVADSNTNVQLTDDELIAAARQGDDGAFQQLVRRHQSRVAATVISMLGKCVEADDVGQETFIRFYHALPHFRGESSVETYLTRIAINLSLNELKRRRRRSFLFLPLAEQKDDAAPTRLPQLEQDERAELLHRAIQRLKPAFRAVVVLRVLEGYSTGETAAMLGISEGTVKSRLARAHEKLRIWLQPFLSEERNG